MGHEQTDIALEQLRLRQEDQGRLGGSSKRSQGGEASLHSFNVPGTDYGLLLRGSPRKFKDEYLGIVPVQDSLEVGWLGRECLVGPTGLQLGLVRELEVGTAHRVGSLENFCGGCLEVVLGRRVDRGGLLLWETVLVGPETVTPERLSQGV